MERGYFTALQYKINHELFRIHELQPELCSIGYTMLYLHEARQELHETVLLVQPLTSAHSKAVSVDHASASGT